MNYEDAMKAKKKAKLRHRNSKLSQEKADAIRQCYLDGDISMADLALANNIAISTVNNIIRNRLYPIKKPGLANELGDK